jgi:hypothetical protein
MRLPRGGRGTTAQSDCHSQASERLLLAQSGRSYANGISWSITNEQKTIQFPTGKEIVKPCQFAQARGQGARQGHSWNIGYGMKTLPSA